MATAGLACAVAVLSLALFAMSAATLWWTVHAWRTPEELDATGFSHAVRTAIPPRLSFSLLVPARHEEAVLGTTLRRMLALRHPDVQVVAIVGHDDPGTAAAARAVEAESGGRLVVVVDHHAVKNKPKALNVGLRACTGDVVGVFDAEDDVDPRLLRAIDATFQVTGADVVQGGVQLINFRASWYALRNCLEYFFWFRSRLHLHARHAFIPLGGNTVFLRREVIGEAGGWDEDCLAEDCELGVRLSSAGRRIAVAYDPHLVTREETPDTLTGLFKQRTRWNQGFYQVLRKGLWRSLPTRRQRWLARWTLSQPFLQAFAGVAVPLSIASMLAAHVPAGVALLSFLPAVPTLATAIFEVVGLREFCRVYYVRVRWLDYVVLLVGTPLYQLVLSGAALRALLREWRGQRGWEKTAHAGSHLGAPSADFVDTRRGGDPPADGSPAALRVPPAPVAVVGAGR